MRFYVIHDDATYQDFIPDTNDLFYLASTDFSTFPFVSLKDEDEETRFFVLYISEQEHYSDVFLTGLTRRCGEPKRRQAGPAADPKQLWPEHVSYLDTL